MLNQRKLRQELVRYGKKLHDKGFVSATDGNISILLDDNNVLSTPTGLSKGMMSPADMVVVDLNGTKLRGDRNVSSEIAMHLTIYRTRPDVKAVVHAHPVTATGFASAGIALDQPICSEVVVTLGAVPLASYATTGTQELSDSLLPFIPDYDAILMANHGVVAYGADLETAYLKMEAAEHFAQITLVTQLLGNQVPLTEENIRKLIEARAKYEGNKSLASMPPGPLAKLFTLKSLFAAMLTAAAANFDHLADLAIDAIT